MYKKDSEGGVDWLEMKWRQDTIEERNEQRPGPNQNEFGCECEREIRDMGWAHHYQPPPPPWATRLSSIKRRRLREEEEGR